MRCPKCGYLSFDHMDTCVKCNKDISKASSGLDGTTYNVAPPSFLKFSDDDRQDEEETELAFDESFDDSDVVDPDLDVLTEDDEIDFSDHDALSFDEDLDDFDSFDDDQSPEIDFGEDDSSLDLDQFEDAFEEEAAPVLEEDVEIDLPDELADISDLSAPAAEFDADSNIMAEDGPVAGFSDADSNDFGLDLDLEEIGDDFSLADEEAEVAGIQQEDALLGDLSLNDIGLSEEEEPMATPTAVEESSGSVDMDADLDFSLDLGGLSLDKEE